jgi:hypothetical protein
VVIVLYDRIVFCFGVNLSRNTSNILRSNAVTVFFHVFERVHTMYIKHPSLVRSILAALVIGLGVLTASCSTPTAEPTRTDILTGTAWRIESTNPDLATFLTPDLVAFVRSFRYRYASNGSVTLTATASGQTATFQGTWRFTDGETKIVYTWQDASIAALGTNYDIQELSASVFRVRQTSSSGSIDYRLVPAN